MRYKDLDGALQDLRMAEDLLSKASYKLMEYPEEDSTIDWPQGTLLHGPWGFLLGGLAQTAGSMADILEQENA